MLANFIQIFVGQWCDQTRATRRIDSWAMTKYKWKRFPQKPFDE